MKKKGVLIALISVVFVLLTGTFLVVQLAIAKSKEETPPDITMMSAYTDCEEYQNVPAMVTKRGKIQKPEDYGNKNWVLSVNGSTVEEYKEYLKTLEASGFKKHSDNGEEGMEGYVYAASFMKDNLTLTVSHAIREDHTYISASFDLPLSDYLIYKESSMEGVPADAKTKVHMMELYNIGNSFVIQLKNGHFVIHDGGNPYDGPYLVDYLEKLTPGDEKPVIEAWFISHAHGDHSGALQNIAEDKKMVDRLYVEGFYYVEPSSEVFSMLTMGAGTGENWFLTRCSNIFKSTSGKAPKMYRPAFGQRYYFCDMIIDVSLTLEQFSIDSYFSDDFNDTSTWLMHYIEGQKFLIAGDTHHTGMRVAMNIFEKDYFVLDVFAVFHHGINVYEYFTEYCTLKTVLYTSFREASIWDPKVAYLARVEDNEILRNSCEEYVSHGGGTVVLTFPYEVGTYEKLPPCDWRYHGFHQEIEIYGQ